MSTLSTPTPSIVETSRGPSVAGTRITIYAIMDYLKGGLSRELIKQDLLLSDEQLNEALQYLAADQQELEHDYTEVVRRSLERRNVYEQVYRSRTKFPPNLSSAEKAELMRQDLTRNKQHSQPEDANDHTA